MGTKLERFLPKNQHILRKFLNFENRSSGKLSKFGHHFSNKVDVIKNVNNKKCAPKFFNEKKLDEF